MSCPCPCQGDPRQHRDPIPWVCLRTQPIEVGAGMWTLGSLRRVHSVSAEPRFHTPFPHHQPCKEDDKLRRILLVPWSHWQRVTQRPRLRPPPRAPAVLCVPPVSLGLIRKLGKGICFQISYLFVYVQ